LTEPGTPSLNRISTAHFNPEMVRSQIPKPAFLNFFFLMLTLPSLGDGDKIWCPFYILDLMRHMTSRYIPRSHQGIIPVLMKVGIVEPVVPQLQPENLLFDTSMMRYSYVWALIS